MTTPLAVSVIQSCAERLPIDASAAEVEAKMLDRLYLFADHHGLAVTERDGVLAVEGLDARPLLGAMLQALLTSV